MKISKIAFLLPVSVVLSSALFAALPDYTTSPDSANSANNKVNIKKGGNS